MRRLCFAAAQFESLYSALFVFIGLNLLQFVIGSYIEPRVAGTAVSVSPFMVLFAVFFWGMLWGAEDELRAQEVFDIAMRRLGTDDRDAFFMRVVELVANTWLTKDDRQAVEQLLSEQRY
jgi:hypothetical protein